MRTKTLGRTDLEVPIVGLGTIFIGSQDPLNPMAGGLDEELGAETVIAAIEGGSTWIDTAPLYAATVSEKIVGSALQNRPDLKDKCTVVTKAGNYHTGQDHSADTVYRTVYESLDRLGLSSFEIVYLHDALKTPFEIVMGKDGALAGLRKLQKEGITKFIGSATNDPKINVVYIETGEFDAAVVPNAWSLLNQMAAQRILPAAEKHNVGISCGTPLERGLLATGPVEGTQYARRNFSEECVAHVGAMQEVCVSHGVPLLAASLQWPSRHPQVALTIPGAKTPEEARSNAEAGSTEIPDALWEELEPMVKHWDDAYPFDKKK